MATIKQPQDHRSPSTRGFVFDGDDGKTYEIPLVSEGRKRLTGRDYRDAMLGGESGQGALMFKILEASDPDADALNALYSMQGDAMMDVLKAWGDFGDGDGASLGE